MGRPKRRLRSTAAPRFPCLKPQANDSFVVIKYFLDIFFKLCYINNKVIERSIKLRCQVRRLIEMAVTIRDVAEHANVSFQLVSAVLGKKSYARASEEIRKRIFDSAAALGYIPNASAGILRGNASKIIGVMIDSCAPDNMKLLMAEIEHQAAIAGYRILAAQAHDAPDRLLCAYHSLKQNGVDGIISLAHDYPGAKTQLGKILKNEDRIIFVRNTGSIDGSAVDIDVAAGIRCALSHLQSEGYQNPGLLLYGNRNFLPASVTERISGFSRIRGEENIFFIDSVTDISEDIGFMEKEISRLIREEFLPRKIDCLIAQNDYLAAICQNMLLKHGIAIPQQFGLVGCDDLFIAQCLPVKLTSLRYDRSVIARKTLELLIERIQGKKETTKYILEPELAVRESSLKKKRCSRQRSVNEV